MHFICYINKSIATKVDSTYLGYQPTARIYHSLATGECEPVTLKSQSPTLTRHRHRSRHYA